MEVDILEIFKGFPEYLKKHLCKGEKKIIKNRFEKSIIQPYLWKYLKEKYKHFCVVKEYLYEEKGQKALDIVLLENDLLKYGIEVKGLPLMARIFSSESSKSNDLKNHVSEIGKDLIRLMRLIKDRTIQQLGILYLAVSYRDEFKFSKELEEINHRHIFKVALISGIFLEVLKHCKGKKECPDGFGISADKMWRERELKELEDGNLGALISLLKDKLEKKNFDFFLSNRQKKLKECLQEHFDKCKDDIMMGLSSYKSIFEEVQNTSIKLGDIDIGNNIKIRSFLFKIKRKEN